jgi:lactoylglutathione lyase
MAYARINLITIRSSDIERAVRFYETLGMHFRKHAHNGGPEHYCSEDAGMVFEIYPLMTGKQPTVETRLGFSVNSLDSAVSGLTEAGARLVAAPADSPWGRRAVLADFDGHRIELTEQTPA